MKRDILFPIIALIALWTSFASAQSLIIDHNSVSAFDSIPDEFKAAASQLRMMYMDRSVGQNISSYLDCLSNEWIDAPAYCKRDQHHDTIYNVDPLEVFWNDTWDRSNWRYDFWPFGCSEDVTCFIDYADDRLDSFDVFGFQFSYLAVVNGSSIADPVTGFFGNQGNDNKASTYAAFEDDHPDKTMIWWTTSLARAIGTPESELFNEQMREFAASNDIILFDVADILSHDPDGNPCFDNRDGVAYKDENHPDDGLSIPAICPQYSTETDGGHLGAISAGGVRVAKAFWVLMARIAGWKENISSTEDSKPLTTLLYPNPSDGNINFIFEKEINSKVLLNVVDLSGKVLYTSALEGRTTIDSNRFTFQLPELNSGFYLIQLNLGDQIEIQKLFIHN